MLYRFLDHYPLHESVTRGGEGRPADFLIHRKEKYLPHFSSAPSRLLQSNSRAFLMPRGELASETERREQQACYTLFGPLLFPLSRLFSTS